MNIFKKLFGVKKLESVPQTGFLPEPDISKIWRTGGVSGFPTEVLIDSGEWRLYRVKEEEQAVKFKFDTMACTSFSANHVVGYLINWMLLNTEVDTKISDFLHTNGYMDGNSFNCSDRFTAIMSNTTVNGNFFSAVWDSIRHNGVIPEKMLPFYGNSFEEYHDKNVITQDMIDLGKEFAKYFDIFYEAVVYNTDKILDENEQALCHDALKQSPLHIAVPFPGTHAIVLESMEKKTLNVFDQYPPFSVTNRIDYPIHYAWKAAVKAKPIELPATTRTLKKGMFGIDVKQLQEYLKTLKFFTGYTTIYFGPKTLASVKAFQKKMKLTTDGIVGPMTLAKLIEGLKKKS